jgi:coenzyme F420-0:L-glutamate ligase / coenzyme F420-1:gamma-L-glutamate ligase
VDSLLREASIATLIAQRRSIRRYCELAISENIIEQLLFAAVSAPSAHNRQPWRFNVLRDAAAKESLAHAMGKRLRKDRTADGDNTADIEADIARSHARLVGAPIVVAVSVTLEDMDRYPDAKREHAENLMAVQSAAMAVQNLLLAAHAHGLGACWMCAPLFCPEAVVEALGLPHHWQPQALITLGYPADRGKPYARKPLSDVVRYESPD